MKLKRIFSFFISCLLLVFISFQSFAAVHSSSNAVMALSLDDDYGISLYSSIGTVTNTVDLSNVLVGYYAYDKASGSMKFIHSDYLDSSGRFSYSCNDNYEIKRIYFEFNKSALPPSGIYNFSYDVASDISLDYSSSYIWTQKQTTNAANVNADINTTSNLESLSGDIFFAPFKIQLTNVTRFSFGHYLKTGVQTVGGSIRINFTPSSGTVDFTTAGTDTSAQDLQSEISSNTTQLVNSTNLILDSLHDLIQHISNQLAALWDQMYNLMHVPTMDKLNEILSALRAIANNSDIYAVVEEIDSSSREQTSQIVQNANENTSKVEQAVEKHGNFIIEGLKGLFIPSDEYFKGYFDDLYTFFSDRFGFLSFPIDLLQRLADLFLNSNDVDCVLTLPSFEISGEQLLTAQSFNLTEFLETNFSMLLSALRIVGDCIIIGAFVNLCSNKWDEVMKN